MLVYTNFDPTLFPLPTTNCDVSAPTSTFWSTELLPVKSAELCHVQRRIERGVEMKFTINFLYGLNGIIYGQN